MCQRGILKLEYIPTDKQAADMLTKNLGKIETEKLQHHLLGSKRQR